MAVFKALIAIIAPEQQLPSKAPFSALLSSCTPLKTVLIFFNSKLELVSLKVGVTSIYQNKII